MSDDTKDSGDTGKPNNVIGINAGSGKDQPSLLLQLERARFERALEVLESLVEHRALLTTTELARINHIVIGVKHDPNSQENPWRQDIITLELPSGRTETMNLIENPVFALRDQLHRTTERSEAGDSIEAAIDLYVWMVKAHAFKEGNRRTAVLATLYFLQRYGHAISGIALHEVGLGDVRDPTQREALKEMITQMSRFASKRG